MQCSKDKADLDLDSFFFFFFTPLTVRVVCLSTLLILFFLHAFSKVHYMLNADDLLEAFCPDLPIIQILA